MHPERFGDVAHTQVFVAATVTPADTLAVSWFSVINVVTFLAFGFDKWRAGRSGRRTPELTLLMLAVMGGWPGGLLGMKLFRHKTAKGSFQFKYALALVPFVAELWTWWHWR
jgi:uncharacterized membrane protein YsdA (DUF1294 family)